MILDALTNHNPEFLDAVRRVRRYGSESIRPKSSKHTNSGKNLNREWRVGALHALYHHDGTFYQHLHKFPGALFDRSGYVVFETESSYRSAAGLHHGQKLNVPGGISSLTGYTRKR